MSDPSRAARSDHYGPATFAEHGIRDPLAGRHPPFDVDGRIPLERLTTRQRGQLNRWLWDCGIKADRVDAGSVVERDPRTGEWRIGLRTPAGGYVVVRRLDPRSPMMVRRRDRWADVSSYVAAVAGGRVHVDAGVSVDELRAAIAGAFGLPRAMLRGRRGRGA
jgi:hypothetical protein